MENASSTDQPASQASLSALSDAAKPGAVDAPLRQSEQRYRSVFEVRIDAVLQMGVDGQILAALDDGFALDYSKQEEPPPQRRHPQTGGGLDRSLSKERMALNGWA